MAQAPASTGVAASAAPGTAVLAPVGSPIATSTVTPEGQPPTGSGGGIFGLERHEQSRKSANSPLDWAAIVLAIIAPPVGLLVGIAAAIVGSRSRGYAAGIAKAAIVVAVVMSIIGAGGAAVFVKLHNDAAGHDAIVASSAAWCTQLKSNPATLASPTYGWPAPATTIPASEVTMQAYVDYWTKLAAIAPAGIKTGTQQLATAASSILATVKSSQTIDDASNIQNMQTAASGSGVGDWVTEYCN